MIRAVNLAGALAMTIALAAACGGEDDKPDAEPAEPSTVTATATATATEVVTTEAGSGLTLVEACRGVGDALPEDSFFPPGYGDDWVDFSAAITQIYTDAGEEARQAIEPFYDKILEFSHAGAGNAVPGIKKIIKLSKAFTKALGKLENACVF